MLTVQESRTMDAVFEACRKYTKIDWEQRRYEIAKECMARICTTSFAGFFQSKRVCAEMAVNAADALIEELKNKKENKNE